MHTHPTSGTLARDALTRLIAALGLALVTTVHTSTGHAAVTGPAPACHQLHAAFRSTANTTGDRAASVLAAAANLHTDTTAPTLTFPGWVWSTD